MRELSSSKLQQSYLIGGIILALIIFFTSFFIDYSLVGAYYGLGFGSINFILWKFLLQKWFFETSKNKAKIFDSFIKISALIFKLGFMLFTIYFVSTQGNIFIISFILGFTAFLFVGILFFFF